MNGRVHLIIAVILLMITAVGCASIPPEAPELSVELGKRISAIEESNVILMNRFFEHKRNDIDEFIQKEWIPIFAEKVFSAPEMSNAWATVVREDDKEQRLEFIVKVGQELQQKINSKRLELIGPLDELERKIETNIRAEYSQARAINNSITSFLMSASEVTEHRNRYLEMLGISEENIGGIIDETDSIVSGFLEKARSADEKTDTIKEYIERINSIRQRFLGKE